MMPNYLALTISIGVLGAIDTYLTATVLPIPVWVTFIAWASYFAVGGGGSAGLLKSVVSNWTGIVIATISLMVAGAAGGSPIAAAICVGLGSAAMILATRITLTSFPPAIVFGFASFVGTTAATGHGPMTPGLANPTLVAAVSMLVGGLFGFVSEIVANALAARPVTA
jgi:hypothetical protein